MAARLRCFGITPGVSRGSEYSARSLEAWVGRSDSDGGRSIDVSMVMWATRRSAVSYGVSFLSLIFGRWVVYRRCGLLIEMKLGPMSRTRATRFTPRESSEGSKYLPQSPRRQGRRRQLAFMVSRHQPQPMCRSRSSRPGSSHHEGAAAVSSCLPFDEAEPFQRRQEIMSTLQTPAKMRDMQKELDEDEKSWNRDREQG